MISFNRLFVLLMIGFLCLGIGIFIALVKPYDMLFRWKIVFREGGEIFEMWRKPEVELYLRVYLFNITNAEDYMAGKDSKLKLKEVGPFVYREHLEHRITKFNENGTLSAIPKHPLTWVEELSEGNKEDDILYLPHIALLSIANVVAPQSFVTRFGLNNLIGLTNSQPLAKMTARQFMMGYESDLMTFGNTFMPGWIYFDKLGLIDRMYDFNGDYETIYTGQKDQALSGLIDTYRGSTELSQWQEKHCSNVHLASDGAKFRSGLSKNDSLLFFRKSMCRAAPLYPVKDGVKNGLEGRLYTFPEHMLDNGKYIKENKCFCRNGKCLPEGLLDVTDCYYGFPIALSYPHFYKGDDVLFNKIEGLTPNQELHETRFWVQPESGLPLDVSAKFQINMALDDISNMKNTEKFANIYLPLLWFDIRLFELPTSMETRFKLYLNILPVVERCAMYIGFIIGSVLIIITIYILTFKIMFKTYKKNQCNNLRPPLWSGVNSKQTNVIKDSVYEPCEIPINESESDNSDQIESNKSTKLHSNILIAFGHRISNMYNAFGKPNKLDNERSDRKQSLINAEDSQDDMNEAYKSDSCEEQAVSKYRAVNQTDSEDDCKYLEVLDDGSGFDDYVYSNNERSTVLKLVG
ncbi:scavenger receptor class B member 1-like isoform X2 [Leptidea sinapis]|uniref:scavenger receptor class B member 1-like isoform X2 n=1 Tax=Leptidea sinapis TaxID=189913 RepID=UPI0021C3A78B|nr:scavenger receptor class B member 1-like isoform X2 [Leptidea sinapis]